MNQLIIPSSVPATTNQQLDFILLDASSSMNSRWWESLAAIDSYVAGLKAAAVPTKVMLATFTAHFGNFQYDLARDCTLDRWLPCCEESPPMWAGVTPLYDAINTTLRTCKDANPSKCSILIVTDGEENCSTTTLDQAKALLDWARSLGWQITFLGCDFNNLEQAKQLGASAGSTLGTSAAMLSHATADLAKKRSYHATHGTPMHFTDAERAHFGGYLGSR